MIDELGADVVILGLEIGQADELAVADLVEVVPALDLVVAAATIEVKVALAVGDLRNASARAPRDGCRTAAKL